MTLAVPRRERTFGATMMVTGCCIGAGMIGLPVLSAAAGFLPSFLAISLAYLFTTATGLLLLEATLWFKTQANYLTIAQFALGTFGKFLVGGLFLFLFYGIFVSYLDGGGQVFNAVFNLVCSSPLPREIGIFTCAATVSLALATGALGVDRINRLFLIGLGLSYFLIIALGLSHVNPAHLTHIKWKPTLAILPILFISFGYQNLVPSLTHYLYKNVRAIRFAIVLGNLIPLLVYVLWNYVILGMIQDPAGIALKSGLVSELLQEHSGSCLILPLINTFVFFALFTSFITVGLSFIDFLRDGFLKAPREPILHALVLLPPLAISLSIPNLFLSALSFAGGVIDVILYGMLPVVILWIGRYHKNAQGPYRIAGGKLFLLVMFSLSVLFLALGLL